MAPAPLLQPRSVSWRTQVSTSSSSADAAAPAAADAAVRTLVAAADAAAAGPSSPFASASGAAACPATNDNDNTRRRPQSSSTTLLTLAWRRYQHNLRRRPLATKALTCACVAALSDATAQAISASAAAPKGRQHLRRRYDLARTLKFALLGLVWSGPSAHYWQSFLQRVVPPPPPGPGQQARAMTAALAKVAVDQLTYGPACNLVFMAYTTLVIGRGTVGDLAGRVRRDYVAVQRNGWRVWPLAGLINYRFVPLEYRVLFMNMVALLWTTYLNVKAA